MLVQYVNSPDGKNYFEILSVGQRFLSADNFPRKVEQVLKKMDKVLDFDDFVQCVKNAGDVTVMKWLLFCVWKCTYSKARIKVDKITL